MTRRLKVRLVFYKGCVIVKNLKRQFTIESITYDERIKMGECECRRPVFKNQLFVRNGKEYIHFACYNNQKRSE